MDTLNILCGSTPEGTDVEIVLPDRPYELDPVEGDPSSRASYLIKPGVTPADVARVITDLIAIKPVEQADGEQNPS